MAANYEREGLATYKPQIKETFKKTDAKQAGFSTRKVLEAYKYCSYSGRRH